ncbi:MAG: PAS domain S-box protein [Chloroflexi bacterium]|nr:PAS domain S-box protein [Chloroflexota bacterium]
MAIPLTVLIVEDSKSDTQLIEHLLRQAGYDVVFEQIEDAGQMRAALTKREWDIVISDYSLPQFNGQAALNLLKETGRDIPFIVLSGLIGEESAVAMMKAGAHDYLRKSDIARLAPAIARELEQARERRERKRAEEALRLAEKKYRNLVEQIPLIIYLDEADELGSNIYISPHVERLFGYAPGEFAENPNLWHKLLHPEDYEIAADTIQGTIETGRGAAEYRMITRDGRTIWVRDTSIMIRDENGTRAFIQGFIEDITERKLAHEALRESEERLSAVMEGSQLGYSDWYIQTGEVRRNERWAGMLGYTLKEIETTFDQWDELLHPDDRMDALQALQDHLDGKTQVHRDEYRLRAKDGGYRWILDQGMIVEYDLKGQPLRMTATHTDITERKQAEDQLRQLSRAVEQSPASIVITNVAGKIEYVNPKFTALTGYSLDEARGKTPRLLKSDKSPPEIYADLWQTILAGKEWRGEFVNRKKNGDTYWEYASISAITDAKGNITHFVAVNEDITTRKKTEERVRSLNIELEKQALTDYLTNLYNRRYFMQRGVEEFKRAKRNDQPLSLLMLDIDGFKQVNDSYGHEAGDRALQQVASALKSNLRETDVIGRMGGEEFAMLLPNTSVEDAALLAERVRETIAATSFETPTRALTITACIGVSALNGDMSNIDDMFRHADAALYHAKNNGRNRTARYTELQKTFNASVSGMDGE